MVVKNRKVTRIQLANDKLRVRFTMWHNKIYQPRYSTLDKELDLPLGTISHWLSCRNLSYERLERIEQLIEAS